jgi:hypothetical protein
MESSKKEPADLSSSAFTSVQTSLRDACGNAFSLPFSPRLEPANAWVETYDGPKTTSSVIYPPAIALSLIWTHAAAFFASQCSGGSSARADRYQSGRSMRGSHPLYCRCVIGIRAILSVIKVPQ